MVSSNAGNSSFWNNTDMVWCINFCNTPVLCQTALVRPHCVAALLRNVTFSQVDNYMFIIISCSTGSHFLGI